MVLFLGSLHGKLHIQAYDTQRLIGLEGMAHTSSASAPSPTPSPQATPQSSKLPNTLPGAHGPSPTLSVSVDFQLVSSTLSLTYRPMLLLSQRDSLRIQE